MLKCKLLLLQVFTLDLFHEHNVLWCEVQLMSLYDSHSFGKVFSNFISFMHYNVLEPSYASELVFPLFPEIYEVLVSASE